MDSFGDPRSRVELYKAFRTLFDPLRASERALGDLTTDAVQTTYRKRVFEVHPDRAAALGVSPALAGDRLRRVTEARALLLAYVRANTAESTPMPQPVVTAEPDSGEGVTTPESSAFGRTTAAQAMSEQVTSGEVADSGAEQGSGSDAPRRLYVGNLPTRPLLLGQFLYYSGKVSWHELIAAVVWQRGLRPKFGDLLLRLGMLSRAQVAQLLAERSSGATLGERAMQRGYLDGRQVGRIVALQRRLQRPIGEYFVESGLLRSAELRSLVRHQHCHNRA
jgi:hypothetical protein